MFAPEVLGPTVDRLAALAGGGRALEFAIGTGRVAVPAGRAGVPVTGIELSRADDRAAAEKADEATIPVVDGRHGDGAGARASFTLVYLVFNTISNLLTQDEQVACFRNAARHLEPGGRFVIELWVPELRRLPPGVPATVGVSEPGYILLDTYDVLHQHVVSHHFTFDEAGGREAASAAARTATSGRRARPDGAAGRVRAESPARRLAGRGVHRRLPLPRLGLPAARGLRPAAGRR